MRIIVLPGADNLTENAVVIYFLTIITKHPQMKTSAGSNGDFKNVSFDIFSADFRITGFLDFPI